MCEQVLHSKWFWKRFGFLITRLKIKSGHEKHIYVVIFLQLCKLNLYILWKITVLFDILYVLLLYLAMKRRHRCESIHRTIKASIDPSMKLYGLVKLYDQVMEELNVQDGHNHYMTLHTYLVIGGMLCDFKPHSQIST